MSNTRLRSVRVDKYITDIDKNGILSSQFINVLFDMPDVSVFINDRSVNVFTNDWDHTFMT